MLKANWRNIVANWRDKLVNFVKENNFKTCVEIGVWKGGTAFRMLKLKDIEYYMVDPYAEKFNHFTDEEGRYVSKMGEKNIKFQNELDEVYADMKKKLKDYPNAKLIRETSMSAVEQFEDASVDFIFIDAVHTYKYAKEDIIAWLPKVKSGGVLAGHDYCERFPGVIRAVDEIFPNCEKKYRQCWIHEVK